MLTRPTTRFIDAIAGQNDLLPIIPNHVGRGADAANPVDCDAFEAEFVAASGRTQALVTLTTSNIRPVRDDDRVAVLQRARQANIFSQTFEAHGIRLPFASQAEPVWDNEVFMKLHRRWVPESFACFGEVEIEAHGIMEITFQDPPAAGRIVRWTLQQLTDVIGNEIFPAFRPYLD